MANYRKQRYVCRVEAAEDGEGLVYVLQDGTKHRSPSSAGSKVMGGKAVNGWRFWSVEGEQAEASEDDTQTQAPAKATKRGKVQKLIYRIPNQQGVAEGKAKFFCTACMKSFVVEADVTPERCPEGHSATDAELMAPAGAEVAE